MLSGSAQLALDDYREAIRLDPNYAPAFFQRGIVLCDCLGEFDRAIADFDAAVRLDPKQPLAYYNRAVACAAKGDLEGALAGWSEAIRLDPRFARAYFERGILYCNGLDEYGKAVADFNQVLRFAPELLVAYYNRGIACYNRGDLDQALASWTRAIQLGFTRVEVYCSRGILYAKRGELQKAVADFDEAIRIDPQYAPAYSHRAAARAALGQAQKASDARAEAARLLEIQRKSTRNDKAAGEVSLTTTPLTGQASPGRLVCASEEMTSCILRRTGNRLESRTMFFLPLLKKLSRPGAIRTGQAHLKHFPRPLRPRRLCHEPLEERQLLSAVSGTVFEDLDADGVRDPGEPELEGWTVVLDRTDTPDLLLTIPNPTPATNDQFGRHLAAVGSNVLAGAELDDAGAEDAGVVHLFDGSTGELLHTFLNPTPDAGDWFGKHLAASDNNVLIGATGDDTGAENTGAVYLFDGSTGQRLRTFLNPTPEPGQYFGTVASLGDNVLVGAGWATHEGLPSVPKAGQAYLFDGSTGELLHTLQNPNPEEGENFGGRVTAVGSNVLIADNLDDTVGENLGAAYLFHGETGELLHTFLDPTPHDGGDGSGSKIAAMGDNVLIAEFAWTDPTSTGAVHLFDTSTGELLRTFLHPDPTPGDLFGFSIAVAGNNILIGARGDDTGATDAGAAFLFDGITGELLHTYLNPTPDVDDEFGSAACAVGNNFIIGARYDDRAGTDAGTLYVFEGPAPIPEPSTMTLLLGGGVCLLIHARRLRRRRG